MPVVVHGLTELNRTFARLGPELKRELRDHLKTVGEPVRARAQLLAAANIRNIGPRWSQMKVGTTSRVVYVAPKSRRRGGSPRANLAGLLMNHSLLPALEMETPTILAEFESMLDRLAAEDF